MRHRRAHGQASFTHTSGPRKQRWRWLLASAVGLVGPALFAGTAGATGSYPGETLSLALNGPAVAGKATQLVASGQQLDVNDYAGGFDLNVFAKDPNVDPTCAPSYWQESNNSITNPSEIRIVIGDWQGMDSTTFSVPFSAVFDQPGPVLLCAYSDWITDTAASAQLTVDLAGSAPAPSPPVSTPVPTPPVTGSPGVVKPLSSARPRVTRSGRTLRCSRGVWSNAPSAFSYRWTISGHGAGRAHGSRLAVSRSLRGHSVRCSVTATNTAGAATAVSRPFSVR